MTTKTIHIILYYKYVLIEDAEIEKQQQEDVCTDNELDGRILLSDEGVNGTLAGSKEGIQNYINYLCSHPIFQMQESDFKHSSSMNEEKPFPFLQIRIVKEVVSTGNRVSRPNSNESKQERGYLTPEEFHKAMDERDKDTIVLDVRNHYEYLIGHFDDAVDPVVRTFSEYIDFMKKQQDNLDNKKVLMYCTGGIRCEKASNYLRAQGIQDVHHLHGGIHNYLQAFPDGGHFKGKNFVFDKRIAMKGSAASTNETIIGTCIECHSDFDLLQPRNLCTVCRDMVLTCPACVIKLNGELHCDRHQYLKTFYFTFVQYYTKEELIIQWNMLNDIFKKHEFDPEWKKKRKMLRKQIEKVGSRMSDFESGVIEIPDVRNGLFHCRTCLALECDGRCWGYWV